ncbi:1,4-alpha-glucan branching protein domain-containing protein [Paenibacillus sp. SI8]|uniref:1,4-alpha-glucan branching protein domain-containing protein n=1 Tax=unclassified Paenibacillus TaxID=185978 RepID=UPI003465F6CC
MITTAYGYVAVLLHAHLPFVRQENDLDTLEERWFFEAVVDSYLPLIDMMERLLEDGVRFRLTLSLSPPLLAMMEDQQMRRKLRKHLAARSELAEREVFRLWGDADFAPTAIHYAERYRRLNQLFDRLGGDLITKLRSLRDTGCVELITCAATHAFLPLVKNDTALRAQLEAAVTEFRRHFGAAPAGIWLPECGYTPAVEPHLQALGLRYFVVDAHTHALATPAGVGTKSVLPEGTGWVMGEGPNRFMGQIVAERPDGSEAQVETKGSEKSDGQVETDGPGRSAEQVETNGPERPEEQVETNGPGRSAEQVETKRPEKPSDAAGHALPAAGLPLRTRGGACAFARDLEASAQVWSAVSGYPGDADYREYYRDIGYDLGRAGGAEWEYIKPYVLPDGERIHTGLKYYRVTGAAASDAKAPYHPERAALKAQQHAEHFVASRVAQLRRLASEREAHIAAAGNRPSRPAEPPVIVCPYDAELFGHWWYEGPQWLEAVLRGLDAARSKQADVVVSTTTLGDYAAAHAPTREAELPVSSWGRGGYAEVWLQPRSQWVHPQLHAAEDRMLLAARKHPDASLLSELQKRALNQAARELMLAQSSDWTFIIDAGTVVDYAKQRIRTHLEQFHLLLDHIEERPDRRLEKHFSDILDLLEKKTPFLPELHYELYAKFRLPADDFLTARAHPAVVGSLPTSLPAYLSAASPGKSLRILMLAWEYPPRIIGGLARAVCDLSKQLAAAGHTVHVITCFSPECHSYELADGVHVHRVPILQSIQSIAFLDWVFQMNMAFADMMIRLSQQDQSFDVIHAHDWLVGYAAKESKRTLRIPLVATIHATEFGRNQGVLETDIQKRIHRLEAKLSLEADHLIACSQYMQTEVIRLFELSDNQITHIPNGVGPYASPSPSLQTTNPVLHSAVIGADTGDRIICFLGRLVLEKGVHTLIAAMNLVLERFPQAKLVIAGAGPEENSLRTQACSLGDRVSFTGFLDESDKQLLLHTAELCVFPSLYEPFGLVALEAMASHTPLIVSDTGGLAEIVKHGIDGYKVTAGSIDALACQIIKLLEHPELAARIADAAAVKVQHAFNWNDIRTATTEVYYQVITRFSQHSGIAYQQKEIMG